MVLGFKTSWNSLHGPAGIMRSAFASNGACANAQVSDNSGAKIVQCIQKSGTQWTIGDVITVAVKKARGGKVGARMLHARHAACQGVPAAMRRLVHTLHAPANNVT